MRNPLLNYSFPTYYRTTALLIKQPNNFKTMVFHDLSATASKTALKAEAMT